MGGFAKVTIPKRGPMIIENTNKEGQSTDMQQKSINEWSKIINGEGDAIINIHRNNPTILIGSYAKETIDIGDIESIGNEKVITSVGTLIHECSEQYYKQVNKFNYDEAHKIATEIESTVSGKKTADVSAVFLVRIRGFEPPPNCSDTDLNRARLPVPPYPHDYSIIH